MVTKKEKIETKSKKLFFKIKGIPGFDGLLVRGDPTGLTTRHQDDEIYAVYDLVDVQELINLNVVVGDRQLKFPIPPHGMFLSKEFLTSVPDPELKQFDTNNPFGTFEYEGNWKKDTLEIAYAVFKNATTVTVMEGDGRRTRFTGSFFGQTRQAEALMIVEKLLVGDLDCDDVVLELEAIKESA